MGDFADFMAAPEVEKAPPLPNSTGDFGSFLKERSLPTPETPDLRPKVEMQPAPEAEGFFENFTAGILEGGPRMVETMRAFEAMQTAAGIAPRQERPTLAGTKGISEIEGPGDFAQWLGFTAGSQVPNFLASAAGAIAGAAGGTKVFPGVGTAAGAIGGATGVSYALNAGEIYQDLIDEGVDPEVAQHYANLGGFAAGALDAIVPGRVGSRIFSGPIKKQLIKQALKNIGKEALIAGPLEGLTEATQGLIAVGSRKLATGQPLELTEEDVARLQEEAAAGLFVGGLAGSVSTAVQSGRGRTSPTSPTTEDPSASAAEVQPVEPVAVEKQQASQPEQAELIPPQLTPEEEGAALLQRWNHLQDKINSVPNGQEIPPAWLVEVDSVEDELIARSPAVEEEPTGETLEEKRPSGGAEVTPEPDAPPVDQTVLELPVSEVAVDPVRFQFKRDVGQAGAGEELRGVQTFDPELAGVVSVWKDPADGKTYVVNGHHRLELAERTGTDNVRVQFLGAEDAQDARAKGALINIAEGRGTPVDAAKLFRDMGITAEVLEEKGISLKGAVARDGNNLANLAGSIFDMVVSGDLSPRRGAIIGEMLPNREDQTSAIQLMERAEQSGKHLTDEDLRELLRRTGTAEKRTETQTTLFGDVETTQNLAIEEAQLSSHIRQRLSKERRLFAAVGKQKAAAQLGEAGNVIQADRNAALAQERAQALEVYDRLSTRAGPVDDAIRSGAQELAAGGKVSDVRQNTFDAIRRAVSTLLTGAAGPVSQGTEAGAPSRGRIPGAKLPRHLTGAKPRFGFGSKQFELQFESDLDKAAFITAQKIPSKRDAEFLKFASDATGMSPTEVRSHGRDVRSFIKELARNAEPGLLKIRGLLSETSGSVPIQTATLGLVRPNPLPVRPSQEPSLRRRAGQLIKPTLEIIRGEGTEGQHLAQMVERAQDRGEVAAGQRLEQLQDTDVSKLKRDDAMDLHEVIEGRKEGTQEEQAMAARVKAITDELADSAEAQNILVRRGDRKVPFQRRRNYFPHVIREAEMARERSIPFGSVFRPAPWTIVRDVVDNLQRLGVRNDQESAVRFLDEYLDFVESGTRARSLMQHLIKTGQAKDTVDASRKLRRHRNELKQRHGSLEFSREIDLPFYDPDPRRVLPHWIAGASTRLENVRVYGQESEKVEKLLIKMESGQGDAEVVRGLMEKIMGTQRRATPGGDRIPRMIRMVQGFRLGLAAIPNATQGVLNSWYHGDIISATHGLAQLFRSEGRRFGRRSGAAIDTVINEMMKEAGGDTRALGLFLKATGFSATEKWNRIVSANAGAHYGGQMARRLKKNPDDIRANRALRELGVEPSEVTGGKLTPEQTLLIGKKFSDITQARSRPSDIPFWASSPWGKVFFQFKTFIYNQTRLVFGRGMIDLLKTPGKREFGRAARNLLLLTSVFPATGAMVKYLRDLVTGREPDDEALQVYLEGISQSAAAGFLGEVIQSAQFQSNTGTLVGPSVSELGELLDLLAPVSEAALSPADEAKRDKAAARLFKTAFRRIPLIGQVLYPRVFPRRKRKRKIQGLGQ